MNLRETGDEGSLAINPNKNQSEKTASQHSYLTWTARKNSNVFTLGALNRSIEETI